MKPKNIYGWNGFELISGDLIVGIVPSLGGRIMSLRYQGHELLFSDPHHAGEVFNPHSWMDLTQAKKSMGFRVWGGDKTWIAPQSSWLLGIPPLDLDAAPYAMIWNKEEVVMTSPVCRETGLQIIRKINVSHGQVSLIEELYNRTLHPLRKGLWNVTQVKRPCYFEIPAHPGGFRSYHHEDKTLPPFIDHLTVKDGILTVDCSHENLFKIGGLPSAGEVKIYLPAGNQTICWQKSFSYEPQSCYAHGSIVEVFNSSSYPYAEIELHTPFKVLNPDQSVRMEQIWKISSCPSSV